MPYLKPTRRKFLDDGNPPETGADLDYLFLKTVDKYHAANGITAEQIITVSGSLVTSLLEYYRRVGAPYEQRKAAENGDVFGPDTIQALFARETVPQGRSSLADANAQADADAADAAAGAVTDTAESVQSDADAIPQESERTLEQDGVQGIEGGGFGSK